MNRVDAEFVTTQVVERPATRDWATKEFIGNTMAESISMWANCKLAIASAVAASAPIPTSIWPTRAVYLRPETFEGAIIGAHRKLTPFGAMLSEANTLAAAFCLHTHYNMF